MRMGIGVAGARSVLVLVAGGRALVLQVAVTVLAHAHRGRDLQPLDLRLEATAPANGEVKTRHKALPFYFEMLEGVCGVGRGAQPSFRRKEKKNLFSEKFLGKCQLSFPLLKKVTCLAFPLKIRRVFLKNVTFDIISLSQKKIK